jgi:hypothetical protein
MGCAGPVRIVDGRDRAATTLNLSAQARGQSLQVFISRDCISGIFAVVIAFERMRADEGFQMFCGQRGLSYDSFRQDV